MLFLKAYYTLKPFIPYGLRLAVRRMVMKRRRALNSHCWPIQESAGRPPENWPGWPDGKKFALVLTHDVECRIGFTKCRKLKEMEMQLGFRSSFNFVPERDYITPPEWRQELARDGFEVGVHDLHHNGKLYFTKAAFESSAKQINKYLAEWEVVGFRSAYMLHNLDWIHDLNILYDASTFDTDPFEPQPDGVNTIFPFWVPRPLNHPSTFNPWEGQSLSHRGSTLNCSSNPHPLTTLNPQPSTLNESPCQSLNSQLATLNYSSNSQPLTREMAKAYPTGDQLSTLNSGSAQSLNSQPSTLNSPYSGYMELPYTLPQDSTLFIILQEDSIDVWKRKLDWIAQRGGMALLNTHPDYMNFDGRIVRHHEYPARFYLDFLEWIKQKYAGQYWNALPQEVARKSRIQTGVLAHK